MYTEFRILTRRYVFRRVDIVEKLQTAWSLEKRTCTLMWATVFRTIHFDRASDLSVRVRRCTIYSGSCTPKTKWRSQDSSSDDSRWILSYLVYQSPERPIRKLMTWYVRQRTYSWGRDYGRRERGEYIRVWTFFPVLSGFTCPTRGKVNNVK